MLCESKVTKDLFAVPKISRYCHATLDRNCCILCESKVAMEFLQFQKSLGILTSICTETDVYCLRIKLPWSFTVLKIILRVSRYSHINLDRNCCILCESKVAMEFLQFQKSLGIVTSIWTETVVYYARVKLPWSFCSS